MNKNKICLLILFIVVLIILMCSTEKKDKQNDIIEGHESRIGCDDRITSAPNGDTRGCNYFPSNQDTPDNIPSFEMLKEILEEINFSRFAINNIDMTIISQKINISSKREVIEVNISKLLSLDENKINLKGKSVDKLGIIGNKEASAALVSISLSNALSI